MLFHMDYRESLAYTTTLARQIRAEIAAAQVTTDQIATQTHIARSTLRAHLNGTTPLTATLLLRIAAAIPIDPHLLIARADERHRTQQEAPHRPGGR